MASQASKTVYLVDSDEPVRRAMKRLFLSADIEVRAFASIDEFLVAGCSYVNACLVADVNVFEEGQGLEMKLTDSGCQIPLIFVSSHDNRVDREKARQLGAVAYFLKPVDGQALLDAIEWATPRN